MASFGEDFTTERMARAQERQFITRRRVGADILPVHERQSCSDHGGDIGDWADRF